MRKKKLVKLIKDMMTRAELDIQYLDDQHSRAYHSGMVDGMGEILYAVAPKDAKRFPIAIAWFTEDEDVPQAELTRLRERGRERAFEHQNSKLFQTIEAD